ncbi:glycoside hydrolase family protein [Venturia nashicola]|uniref:mannan endo-1,4-beta-mannosidase n=1 Tax=Venturia nashicola TaxID=86259 RepID=A0A4Z1PLZ2_9PEZI|nr:glycoside hydrolase family 5 protein [Venturia nashicola]TLD37032.1 glycoside hydrolase family protein [Venturia nashicola]
MRPSILSTVLAVFVPFCVAAPAALAATDSFTKVTKGLKFEIDGVAKYWAGTNGYWIPFLMKNADIDLTFDHIAAAGLKIVRTWGFNDVTTIPSKGTPWFQSFVSGAQPVINTGADGLQRLDYVVASAAKRGIKLVIPFVNNWSDYGGMPAYAKFYNLNLPNKNNSAWYTSTAAQKQYQTYIQAVVSRYVNSTAILGWELANEPRCNGCPTSTITTWATKTSQFIKSIDKNHLVAMGDEGFGLPSDGKSYPYSYGEGVDFAKNLAIPDLDFGTLHLYPESWSITAEDGTPWAQAHAKACVAAKKPCLFEEYGVKDKVKCAKIRPWQKASLAMEGMAGDLYWQAGETLSYGKSHDDGNTVYPGDENWKCMVVEHGAEVKAKV